MLTNRLCNIQTTINILQTEATSLQTAYAIQSLIAGLYAERLPVDVAGKCWQASQQQLFLVARDIFWRRRIHIHHHSSHNTHISISANAS